ncbi:MAG TPA: hypothetical protein VK901_02885 [Nitrospiraceae bacterium]|nr:hypothetical protein [Nitrospiraceae bacterium]
MKIIPIFAALGLLVCIGCATPPEVKQALVAKDQAYAENARLMNIHRELLVAVDTRYWHWYRYAKKLALLNSGLKWATTDPEVPENAVEKLTKAGMPLDQAREQASLNYVSVVKLETVGQNKKLLTVINRMRLEGLPERRGKDGQVVFEQGHGDMNKFVQAIPELIEEINGHVEAEFREENKATDYSAFDDYRTNLAALRRINGMIKRYLDIDITVKRDDIRELADSVKALQ